MGNIFGRVFRVATWGESHGAGIGAVVDGCPAGLALAAEDVQAQLDRRRPGQSKLTTQRRELDRVRILSGVFEGKTTGTPIGMVVENTDQKSADYDELREVYRPSHADFTYDAKFGRRDHRGGGRSSARETIGRVAAGAVARKYLFDRTGMEILAYVSRVGDVEFRGDPMKLTLDQVEASPVRCPDAECSNSMEEAILSARKGGDSLGGVIQLVVRGVPVGLGEPVFDRTEAALAAAMLSLPATKGFEIGSGFEGTRWTGSRHNDAFYLENGEIRTRTNHSGGVQGGITNGMPILCRIAFKPTATIATRQETVDRHGRSRVLKAKGRHDPCVLPRAVVIVESMAALVLMDLYLLQRAKLPE